MGHSSKPSLLALLAQEEADDMWRAPATARWAVGDVPLGCAIPVGDVARLGVCFVALGLSAAYNAPIPDAKFGVFRM